jgi:hypothetical protein
MSRATMQGATRRSGARRIGCFSMLVGLEGVRFGDPSFCTWGSVSVRLRGPFPPGTHQSQQMRLGLEFAALTPSFGLNETSKRSRIVCSLRARRRTPRRLKGEQTKQFLPLRDYAHLTKPSGAGGDQIIAEGERTGVIVGFHIHDYITVCGSWARPGRSAVLVARFAARNPRRRWPRSRSCNCDGSRGARPRRWSWSAGGRRGTRPRRG